METVSDAAGAQPAPTRRMLIWLDFHRGHAPLIMTRRSLHRGSFEGHARRPPGALRLAIAAAIIVATAAPAAAQFGAGIMAGPAPRVFLDCQSGVPCNQNDLRTAIQFVNWARDPADADVHVIATGESVGGGGRRYTLEFIGLGDMAHLSDVLTYTAGGTDVARETQDGIAQVLRVGLLRYAVQAGRGGEFDVRYVGAATDADEPAASPAAVRDPWNFWTFRVGLSGNLDVTENRQNYRTNPSFGADRVTEAWKFNINVNANLRWEKIVLSSGREVRNDVTNWGANMLLVRSMSPNTSTGITMSAGSSVAGNTRTNFEITPGLEWNYFPYAQASRRQLIAHYGAGIRHNQYREETVFGVTEETVPLHKLGIQYRAVAPWGNAGIGVDARQFLHAGGLYNFGASGNISLRVTRGLELSLSAQGSRVADQIHIPAGTISEEDILLGRQSLPTGYSYDASIGLNYRFGSAFSNIVNVRFPASVR